MIAYIKGELWETLPGSVILDVHMDLRDLERPP